MASIYTPSKNTSLLTFSRCSGGHRNARLTPLRRKEICEIASLALRAHGKQCRSVHGRKYSLYRELAQKYSVHVNTIKRIVSRGKHGEYTLRKSERHDYRSFGRAQQHQQRVSASLQRRVERAAIVRYEKEFA
jgi:hypothetical protein